MPGWGQFVNGFECHSIGGFQIYNLDISQYDGWVKDQRG